MKKIMWIVILILIFSLFLRADIYMKNMVRTQAFEVMGNKQGENVEINEQWFAQGKFAQLGKEHSLIVDTDKEKLYFILHKQKIYFELPADFDRQELLKLILGLDPKVAEVIQSIKITDARVDIGSETKKIANWNCTSAELEMVFMVPALGLMPKLKMKMWTTNALPSDYSKYTKVGEEFFPRYILGMFDIDDNSKKELEKMNSIDGFQVASELTINIFGTEINVESQCLEVAEKSAPTGTYSIPKGYTKKTIKFPVSGPMNLSKLNTGFSFSSPGMHLSP